MIFLCILGIMLGTLTGIYTYPHRNKIKHNITLHCSHKRQKYVTYTRSLKPIPLPFKIYQLKAYSEI